MTKLDLSGGWSARCEAGEPAARLAARELETILPRIAGRDAGGESPYAFELTHTGGEGEGFRWRAGEASLELRGESARGLLCGAYALLGELGCRWSWPGEGGETVPRGVRLEIRETVEEGPLLPGRCVVLAQRSLVEGAEDWIAWAARNRLNAIFVHVSLSEDPSGASPERTWREVRERAVPLIRERGMTLEHGGHLLPELVAERELRDLAAGRSAERAAREVLREAVGAHLDDHPEVDVFHLWGSDVRAPRGGPRAGSASEPALRVANEVAAAVAERRPEAQVAHLAYHDTLAVPAGVAPEPNVCLTWAPRERCYEHGAGDAGCERNVRHAELFRAQVEHFRSAGARPPRVFEYYLDAILFRGEPPELGRVMAADLDFYREAGAHTVQALITGRRDWRKRHPNAELFARLAWDPASSAGPIGA